MFWRALTAISLTIIPVLTQAQTGADSVAIVEAAARWYASQVPANSRVGFVLPRGPRSGPAPTPGQFEAAQHGARVLRATLIPFDSLTAKLCDRKNPGDCGPGKFDSGVEVHVIRITGNASEVYVEFSRRVSLRLNSSVESDPGHPSGASDPLGHRCTD
jgi:hypothetical protein